MQGITDMNKTTAITLSIVLMALLLLLAGYWYLDYSYHKHSTRKMNLGANVYNQNEVWTSDQPAAPDSEEGRLRAEHKKWTKIEGEIHVGDYVQDVLEPRLNQPKGRGAIGKVTAISPPGAPPPAADVDFGRGYVAGINLSELSLVNVEPN
jgi:hypothetical protein